jgi:hypothetical protein
VNVKARTRRKRVKPREVPLRGYGVDRGGELRDVLAALALDDGPERQRRLDELARARYARAAAFVDAALTRARGR